MTEMCRLLIAGSWFIMSVGFGQPSGGLTMGEYSTRADCEAARPPDCCEHVEGEPDARVEYACVPSEVVWRWMQSEADHNRCQEVVRGR